MLSAQNPPVQLGDILITEKLCQRRSRAPNLSQENRSLHRLAQGLVKSPSHILQELLESALELCDAGSAGISVLETLPDGNPGFRWIAMAGQYRSYLGGTTPRDFSPCGVTLDRKEPQLFLYPGRLFTYFEQAQPPIVEGLVVPFGTEEEQLGTIWIVSHSEQTEFDSEDVRLMNTLGSFAAAAVRMLQLQALPNGRRGKAEG